MTAARCSLGVSETCKQKTVQTYHNLSMSLRPSGGTGPTNLLPNAKLWDARQPVKNRRHDSLAQHAQAFEALQTTESDRQDSLQITARNIKSLERLAFADFFGQAADQEGVVFDDELAQLDQHADLHRQWTSQGVAIECP